MHRHDLLMGEKDERIRGGRPVGSRTFDPELATAFGEVVRGLRVERGIAQEKLAADSDVERSYFGRLERGQSAPSLAMLFRIAAALSWPAEEIVIETEKRWRKRLRASTRR